MKTLGFNEKLVSLILEGKKTITWRLFRHHEDLKVGNIIALENTQTKKIFGKAKIVSIKNKTMGNLTKKDKESHEEFLSDKKMYNVFSKYYNQKVDSKTPVKIIKFKLIEKA